MDPWDNLLKNLNVDLPADGKAAPPQEYIPKEIIKKSVKRSNPKVLVQKVTTEVWVCTDMDAKTVTSNTFQDITTLGEMTKTQANKLIAESREKRKKETE